MRVGGPVTVVAAQGFAIGVADERGAVVDFGGAGDGRLEILRLGQEREPAAERLLVVTIIKVKELGDAIRTPQATRQGGDAERHPSPVAAEVQVRKLYTLGGGSGDTNPQAMGRRTPWRKTPAQPLTGA